MAATPFTRKDCTRIISLNALLINIDNKMADDEFLDDGFLFRLMSCFDKGEVCSQAN